jgi:Xaa-Pro aminopeptidase
MKLKQSEFARRRKQLMRMVGRDGIAVLPAAPLRVRSRDTHHPYRQDSDFYYLTGLEEPEAVAVLVPGREPAEYIVFCRERDPARELWDGPRLGPDGAIADLGADDAFPISDLDEILPGLMEDRGRVFYNMGMDSEFDRHVQAWVQRLREQLHGSERTPHEFVSLDHLLHDMRLYKSRAEISAMRRAARITVAAHRRAMHACEPEMFEYQLQAELEYEFRRHGAEPAYQTIVGAGPNACVLHHVENDRRMEAGELVLVDAGAELENYASDVTRTYPVGGRFTDAQRDLYEVVLAAQNAAIEALVPGNHWNDAHEAAVYQTTDGLRQLGLLRGTTRSLVRDRAYRPFYMHRTGHWLGLDVHDVGDYRFEDEWRLLEPGMVTTVEPGLYIPSDCDHVDPRWRGIGIRIEDDVLITANGPDVLTRALEKNADAVEALMAT